MWGQTGREMQRHGGRDGEIGRERDTYAQGEASGDKVGGTRGDAGPENGGGEAGRACTPEFPAPRPPPSLGSSRASKLPVSPCLLLERGQRRPILPPPWEEPGWEAPPPPALSSTQSPTWIGALRAGPERPGQSRADSLASVGPGVRFVLPLKDPAPNPGVGSVGEGGRAADPSDTPTGARPLLCLSGVRIHSFITLLF